MIRIRNFALRPMLPSLSAPGLFRKARRQRSKLADVVVENLEVRCLLSGYSLQSTQWSTKQRLTYSIAGDGAYWFKSTNVLNEKMTAQLGQQWRTIVAEAVSAWTSVADVDLAEVPDGLFAGDYYVSPAAKPLFGDIRIGGYDFRNSEVLASAFGPPPNGWSRAGDVSINVGVNWSPGSNYDFHTVILHELGHTLGLDHPDDSQSIMYESYQGVRRTLAAGDIAGIQAIYGARREDSFTRAGVGQTPAQPIVTATPKIGERTTTLTGVELASSNAWDYFRVDVPQGFVGTKLVVTASANAISMLSPALSLVGPGGDTIRTVSAAGTWGGQVQIDLGPVIAGQSFFFRVSAAESYRFAVGGYALTTQFVGGQVPVVTPPVVTPPPVAVPPPVVVTPPPTQTPVNPAPTTPVVPAPSKPVNPPKLPVRTLPRPRGTPTPIRKPVQQVKKTPAPKPATARPVDRGTLLRSLLNRN